MADTGAPHFIPFVEPTDLVREYPAADEASAFAVAAALDAAGNAGIGSNVVQAVKTTSFSTTSSSYVDVTDVTVSITPSSNTAKVLVIVTGIAGNSATDFNATRLQLVRNSTPIGNTAIDAYMFKWAVANSSLGQNIAYVHLDSPETDTATTYKLQVNATGGTTGHIGRTAQSEPFTTTITAIEVAA